MSMWEYHVFLRFSGKDKDFGDQLYEDFKQKGIRVYRDDSDSYSHTGNYYLHKAYQKSMFSIAIVYQKYSHCFANVSYLLTTTGINHEFMPIIYKIKPEAVAHQTGCFGEALELDGGEAPTFYGEEIIETTNEYQSFIDAITKQLRKMIHEKSPRKNLVESRKGFELTSSTGRKGLELTSFLEGRLTIFWDIKSSPFPTNVNPEDIAKKIKAFVKRETNNNWEAVDVYAYGHSSAEQKAKMQNSFHTIAEQNLKLHNSGVTLIHTPRGRKDTTHIALLVDMFKRSHYCPPPSSIMLITGNISYANTLHALGLLGHKIIFVTSSEVDVPVPLINASVYTWSDVAKGTSSSQVQIEELPDDNNNWPGSILIKRGDLVATSSSQLDELSMRCKELESIVTPFVTYLFIFLDLENCPIPREVPAKDVFMNILKFVRDKIYWTRARLCAYADLSRIRGEEKASLKDSDVQLIHTPHVKKDAADEAMMIDMFMYSKLVPSSSSIMVITGDVDFATTLHAIDGFGHDILLAIPSGVDVSESLTSASKDYWYWSEVASGIDLTGLKGQLMELLERNGQLRLGSLVAEYQKIFKKPLRLSEYKARKLVNLLKRMSYMISVEVLNGETLVKLKGDKPSSSRKMIRKEREIDYNIKDLFE